jgi:RimJ/RimL family protein N-acetyltransferase
MPLIFKPLAEEDLEMLAQWLNRPHVMRWWGGEPKSLQEIRDKYIPRIYGEVPCRCFLIYDNATAASSDLLRGDSLGFIQTHWLVDFPDYANKLGDGVDATIAALDLFISAEENLHRGLGQLILRQFLNDVVFTEMKAEVCTLGPSIENKASIRAYEKAGFSHWKTVEIAASEHEYVMKITRSEFESNSRGLQEL